MTAGTPNRRNGFYRDVANGTLDIVADDTDVIQLDSAGLTIPGTMTVTGAVTLTNTLARSQLATESKFYDCMDALTGADGAVLGISETAGDFFKHLGTNLIFIKGEAAVNETEVSVGYFRFVLPENYIDAGTITLRAVVDVEVAGDAVLNASSTVDFEAYKLSETDGTVGSDLVTTAATAVTATAGAKDFVVTPTGLVAGDTLICKLTTSIVEDAAGTGAATAFIYKLGAVVQVKG